MKTAGKLDEIIIIDKLSYSKEDVSITSLVCITK